MAKRKQRGQSSSRSRGTRAGRTSARTVRREDAKTVQFVTPDRTIEIRWPAPDSRELGQIQKLAIEWTHVVRNRARWVETPSLKAREDENARELLAKLGISEADRRFLATAGSVRVTVPYRSEEQFWEARILPWEIVLPSATRDLRTGSLVVTRALRRANRANQKASYRRVLFVESAPGRLATEWEFKEERRLVQHYSHPEGFQHVVSPTRAVLASAVRKHRPDIVHLAGFDTHQGLELVKDPRAESVLDGYLLADDRLGVDPVPAAELAEILSGTPRPGTRLLQLLELGGKSGAAARCGGHRGGDRVPGQHPRRAGRDLRRKFLSRADGTTAPRRRVQGRLAAAAGAGQASAGDWHRLMDRRPADKRTRRGVYGSGHAQAGNQGRVSRPADAERGMRPADGHCRA